MMILGTERNARIITSRQERGCHNSRAQNELQFGADCHRYRVSVPAYMLSSSFNPATRHLEHVSKILSVYRGLHFGEGRQLFIPAEDCIDVKDMICIHRFHCILSIDE